MKTSLQTLNRTKSVIVLFYKHKSLPLLCIFGICFTGGKQCIVLHNYVSLLNVFSLQNCCQVVVTGRTNHLHGKTCRAASLGPPLLASRPCCKARYLNSINYSWLAGQAHRFLLFHGPDNKFMPVMWPMYFLWEAWKCPSFALVK